MPKTTGFHLIELMIVLVIISILTYFSLPFSKTLMDHQRAELELEKLLQMIYTARSEAMKRETRVTLCTSHDFIHCDADWKYHFIIFFEENNKKKIIATFLPLKSTLIWKSFSYDRDLSFNALGMADSSNGTFSYFQDHEKLWQIVVARSGRARSL